MVLPKNIRNPLGRCNTFPYLNYLFFSLLKKEASYNYSGDCGYFLAMKIQFQIKVSRAKKFHNDGVELVVFIHSTNFMDRY